MTAKIAVNFVRWAQTAHRDFVTTLRLHFPSFAVFDGLLLGLSETARVAEPPVVSDVAADKML